MNDITANSGELNLTARPNGDNIWIVQSNGRDTGWTITRELQGKRRPVELWRWTNGQHGNLAFGSDQLPYVLASLASWARGTTVKVDLWCHEK
jgi:hypothetical protein